MVSDVDRPRRGGARQRSEPGRSDRLVYGEQGLQCGWVRVAGERHLTEDVRQATEEDRRAAVSTPHLIHEQRLVLLAHTHIKPASIGTQGQQFQLLHFGGTVEGGQGSPSPAGHPPSDAAHLRPEKFCRIVTSNMQFLI